jgi:hypothetical protein
MMNKMKFATGGLIPTAATDKVAAVLLPGRCLVGRSHYDAVGADMIRLLNNSPGCEILVVPDEKLEAMTPSEKVRLLNE